MRRFDKNQNIKRVNLLTEKRYLNESVDHLVHKGDYTNFIENHNIKPIWDEDKGLFKLYRSQDVEPIAYYNPKYSVLIYDRGSEFDKIANAWNWTKGY